MHEEIPVVANPMSPMRGALPSSKRCRIKGRRCPGRFLLVLKVRCRDEEALGSGKNVCPVSRQSSARPAFNLVDFTGGRFAEDALSRPSWRVTIQKDPDVRYRGLMPAPAVDIEYPKDAVEIQRRRR